MSFADHLGDLRPAPVVGCAVCTWRDQLDDAGRIAFDTWLAEGGSVSELWRKAASWPSNPLQIKRARFSELVNEHHRGGAHG
ncbi:hypothetical protein SEA_NERGAL_30 [Mycobacterium Phage Nergal]|nr:hypothetical protein SEA_NERGAL_30 [Mycobacterium Phage Nergal]